MRLLALSLSAALVFSACTSDSSSDSKDSNVVARFKDGPRLKQITIDVNGAKHFDGIQDTELDIWCDYERMESGNFRCVPTDVTYATERYADSDCQVPIFVPSDECEVRPYFAIRKTGECGSARAIFVASDRIETEQIYRRTSSGCSRAAGSPGSYMGLAPVPEETFVQGTWQVEPLNDQLGVGYFIGSDGSRYADLLHDLKNDFSCYPGTRGGDPTLRCLPSPRIAVTPTLKSDAECKSAPLATWSDLKSGGACQPDAITVRTSCEAEVEFYTAGERVTQSEYYWVDGDTCSAAPAIATQSYWKTGTKMDVNTFLPAENTQVGSGRGAWRVLMVAGHGWEPLQMNDPNLGIVDGYSYFAEDGKYRLLPNDRAKLSTTFFSDAACSQPLIEDSQDCLTAEPKFALGSVPTCDPYGRSSAWRVTGRHSGPVYWFESEESCVQVPEEEQQYVPARLFKGERIDPKLLLETPRTQPQ